jgi:hypothetical protein
VYFQKQDKKDRSQVLRARVWFEVRRSQFTEFTGSSAHKIVLTMSDPAPQISKSDTPTDSSSRPIKFDVGGRLYKVSRSSIERFPSTMLAKMISETWQKDPEVTLFIDRDGDRFRFCLD